jgi:hypothetical protein
MEVNEPPLLEGDTTPFLREDDLRQAPLTREAPDARSKHGNHTSRWLVMGVCGNVMAQICLYINIYIYIHYIHPKNKKEEEWNNRRGQPEAVMTLDGLSIRFTNWCLLP